MHVQQMSEIDQSMVVAEENVRVQCSNSSDFVVGKQTNFNGPVTIINCPVPEVQTKENIVIRDQVWTSAASRAVEEKVSHVPVSKDVETNITHSLKKPVAPSLAKKPGRLSTLPILKDLIDVRFLGAPLVFWVMVSIIVTVCIAVTVVSLSAKAGEDSSSIISDDRLFVGNESHLFFTKQLWNGLNASSKIAIIEPVPFVVISHTAGPFCYETATCQDVIRGIQKDHMSRTPAFADIAFNFMVGGDGYIYEGRGWGVRSPHGGFVGNRNIDINFIGDFSVYDVPTPTQVDAVVQLLQRGVADCHLHPDYILVAHNQTTATLSPGKNVYAIISTWEHFHLNPPKNITRLHHAGLETNCMPTMSPYYALMDKEVLNGVGHSTGK